MDLPVLAAAVDAAVQEHGFSGVVRVDAGDDVVLERAVGAADRAHRAPITIETVFALASGTKTFTALTVLRLVELGTLSLATPARELLGADLALVDDAVTVEQLLTHRSGIGDYVDEDVDTPSDAYVLDVPVHRLVTTEDYLAALDGRPAKFEPGASFSYSNSGYVVLALLAERAAGAPFAELVRRLVCEPAGLDRTRFRRGDEPEAGVATGYLDATGPRTNVLHLPVVGSGDGGISAPVADVHALWRALRSARVVDASSFDLMTRPRGVTPGGHRYGMGLWLGRADDATSDVVQMEGADAGVSFRSSWQRSLGATWTVVSNVTDAAWPVDRAIRLALAGA